MKQGRTLQEVLTELQRQNEMKKDFIVPAQSMRMNADGRTFEIVDDHDAFLARDSFSTTDLFHRQIGSALGIPAKYYDQMRKLKPELLAQNVNAWFGDKAQSYMIRSMNYGAYGDAHSASHSASHSDAHNGSRVARALLSDRYRRIDNMEIASAVLPLFAGQPDMEVMSCEVTEHRMYLKIVNKRLEADVVPGDTVQGGVIISNSEVGLGAVSVQPLLYRLVCSNGLCVNDLGERRTHVGRATKAVDDGYALYSDEALIAEDKAFMLKLRDITMAAIEETRFDTVVDKLRETTQVKITGRVQDVIELTGKNYGLNQPEQDNILNYLIQGGDLSLYGLTNAITRASQDVESYDRATALEGIGWQVATMPAAQWKEINA